MTTPTDLTLEFVPTSRCLAGLLYSPPSAAGRAVGDSSSREGAERYFAAFDAIAALYGKLGSIPWERLKAEAPTTLANGHRRQRFTHTDGAATLAVDLEASGTVPETDEVATYGMATMSIDSGDQSYQLELRIRTVGRQIAELAAGAAALGAAGALFKVVVAGGKALWRSVGRIAEGGALADSDAAVTASSAAVAEEFSDEAMAALLAEELAELTTLGAVAASAAQIILPLAVLAGALLIPWLLTRDHVIVTHEIHVLNQVYESYAMGVPDLDNARMIEWPSSADADNPLHYQPFLPPPMTLREGDFTSDEAVAPTATFKFVNSNKNKSPRSSLFLQRTPLYGDGYHLAFDAHHDDEALGVYVVSVKGSDGRMKLPHSSDYTVADHTEFDDREMGVILTTATTSVRSDDPKAIAYRTLVTMRTAYFVE